MRTTIFILFLLALFSMPVYSQPKPLTDAQRKSQQEYIRNDTLPVIVNALPREVNTRFSEYSGRLLADSIFIFTSMRADVEEDHDRLFETSWYCNLYKSKLLSDGSYSPSEGFSRNINTRNTFNCNFCFNEKGDQIIYSRCIKEGDGSLQCALWRSDWNGKNWKKPYKLPANINAPGSSNMQPFLTTTDGKEILYFVSDRAQGIGGYDIWYAVIQDNDYQTPINAGTTINTEGNEVTPFYDKENNILYFSSDEHLGLGDYDIFYCSGALSQWESVANMGIPFNSEYNDFYFTLNADHASGYFSSNRPHDEMEVTDTCCNDIFHFQWTLPEPIPTVKEDTISTQEKIAAILPITLYFQNDEPDPKSTSDTTSSDYISLYNKYMADINLYISESIRGLEHTDRQEVAQRMTCFLRDSVATGYSRLLLLEQYLKEALSKGEVVEITISGHASPLHNSAYNQHLSMRRITSLINELHKAEENFFKPYLEKKKQGLIIHTNPCGSANHQFQSNESRETVYGLQAAKDRKIVITQ